MADPGKSVIIDPHGLTTSVMHVGGDDPTIDGVANGSRRTDRYGSRLDYHDHTFCLVDQLVVENVRNRDLEADDDGRLAGLAALADS